MKRALITGITGQDGSYLAELLLEKGYQVTGLVRRSSSSSKARLGNLLQKVALVEGDLTDATSLKKALEVSSPDEIYNLAAMSHVRSSFDLPEYTAEVNGFAVLRFLEAVKEKAKGARFYQASTSELFGKVSVSPQTETTPFHPRSPYGIAKLYAFWSVVNYREAYGLYACNGILFNHESPRRGCEFVTRKITLAVAKKAKGSKDVLKLGNLDAKRDWGYAKEYVHGMWKMLQQEKADDFILATGNTHTVREFVEKAFKAVDITVKWKGQGVEEKGFNSITGDVLVEINKDFFRPAEVDLLLGDPSKAEKHLGWKTTSSFEELVRLMVKSDYEALS